VRFRESAKKVKMPRGTFFEICGTFAAEPQFFGFPDPDPSVKKQKN